MKLAVTTPAEVVNLARSGEVMAPWGKSKRKLQTVGACRQEAARIYHMAAAGRVAPEDLSRAVWALDRIARMAQAEQLEKRIEQLEALLRGRT